MVSQCGDSNANVRESLKDLLAVCAAVVAAPAASMTNIQNPRAEVSDAVMR